MLKEDYMSLFEDTCDPLKEEISVEKKQYLLDLRRQMETEYMKWCDELVAEDGTEEPMPFERYLMKIHAGIQNESYMKHRVLKTVQDPLYQPGPLESIVIEYMFVCLDGQ